MSSDDAPSSSEDQEPTSAEDSTHKISSSDLDRVRDSLGKISLSPGAGTDDGTSERDEESEPDEPTRSLDLSKLRSKLKLEKARRDRERDESSPKSESAADGGEEQQTPSPVAAHHPDPEGPVQDSTKSFRRDELSRLLGSSMLSADDRDDQDSDEGAAASARPPEEPPAASGEDASAPTPGAQIFKRPSRRLGSGDEQETLEEVTREEVAADASEESSAEGEPARRQEDTEAPVEPARQEADTATPDRENRAASGPAESATADPGAREPGAEELDEESGEEGPTPDDLFASVVDIMAGPTDEDESVETTDHRLLSPMMGPEGSDEGFGGRDPLEEEDQDLFDPFGDRSSMFAAEGSDAPLDFAIDEEDEHTMVFDESIDEEDEPLFGSRLGALSSVEESSDNLVEVSTGGDDSDERPSSTGALDRLGSTDSPGLSEASSSLSERDDSEPVARETPEASRSPAKQTMIGLSSAFGMSEESEESEPAVDRESEHRSEAPSGAETSEPAPSADEVSSPDVEPPDVAHSTSDSTESPQGPLEVTPERGTEKIAVPPSAGQVDAQQEASLDSPGEVAEAAPLEGGGTPVTAEERPTVEGDSLEMLSSEPSVREEEPAAPDAEGPTTSAEAPASLESPAPTEERATDTPMKGVELETDRLTPSAERESARPGADDIPREPSEVATPREPVEPQERADDGGESTPARGAPGLGAVATVGIGLGGLALIVSGGITLVSTTAPLLRGVLLLVAGWGALASFVRALPFGVRVAIPACAGLLGVATHFLFGGADAELTAPMTIGAMAGAALLLLASAIAGLRRSSRAG